MSNETEDSYEEISGRSPSRSDLLEVTKTLDVLATLNSVWAGEFTVADETGSYIIGEIWWDSEREEWRIDFAKYGDQT